LHRAASERIGNWSRRRFWRGDTEFLVPLRTTAGAFLSVVRKRHRNRRLGVRRQVSPAHRVHTFAVLRTRLQPDLPLAGGIGENQLWIARIGGGVIILFGLYLMGLRPGLFLQRERRFHLKNKPLGYLGSTLVGVTFGAGWSPCIGPILGGILMFAATREMLTDGLVLLGFYSLGLAVPFLLSSLAVSWFLSTFDRFKKYLPWVERASGGLLIVVGLLLMTGRFTMLAAWATQFTPAWVLERI